MEDCNIRRELGEGKLIPAAMLYFPLDIDKAKKNTESDIGMNNALSLEKETVEGVIERTGIFLDDKDILMAQDKELKGEFIPEYTDKAKKKGVFVSLERFEELYEEMRATVEKIGKELLSGDASASPLERKNKTSPCDYCANHAVCRRRK